MHRHNNRAGPQPRWMHKSNRLSGRREIAQACPSGRDCAIVRPVLRSFWRPRSGEDDRQRGRNGQTDYHACVCAGASFLHGWRVLLPVPCDLSTISGLLRSPRTSHQESARQQDCGMPSVLRQAVPACGVKTWWAVRQRMPSSPWRQIYSPHYPPHPCLPVYPLHYQAHLTTKSSRFQPMPFTLYTTSFHISLQHIHPIHTARSYFTAFFLACPLPLPNHSQITRASSHLFCFVLVWFWICFLLARSHFFWFPDLLFLRRDLWVILVLCIFSPFEKFSLCRFSPFREISFWLVFVLSRHLRNRAKTLHFTSPTTQQATSRSSPHDTRLLPATQPHTTYSSPYPPLAHPTIQSHTR